MPPYTRIVSLLPSATEIICELGAAAALRGVTHACPQPAGLPPVPCVVAPAFDASLLDGAGIDARVRAIRREGGDVLALDGDALRDARPDLVICQDTCRACAPYAEQVGGAIEALCGSPEVHSMDPRDMAGIMECISELAALLGREDGGRRLRESLESRVGAVRSAAAGALGDNDGRRPTCWRWSGSTRCTLPATGCPRWSRRRAARIC